ncbi:MAG: hypothetical protein KBB52_01715 [Candidatus Omnitrophica bacterium]|nr:hypothetical protein [Candidatus Omnitrophota bacterium]
MKKIIDAFGQFIDDLKSDIDVYLTIRRYARIDKKEKRSKIVYAKD